MKKRHLLWLIVGLLLLPTIVLAQDSDTDLSEVYETNNFTISYPEDWSIVDDLTGNSGVAFSVPVAGAGGGLRGVIVQREDIRVWLTLSENDDRTALELVQDNADDFMDGLSDAEMGLSLEFLINDREVAFADVHSLFPQRYMAMIVDKDTVLEAMIIGVPTQFITVMPTLMEVLNTFRLADDDSEIEELNVEYVLPETHRRRGDWSFDYPAEWDMEDRDTFTLMTVPSIETTLGLGATHQRDASDLEGYAGEFLDNILDQAPDLEYEVYEFETEDYVAIRTDFTDPESDFAYTSIVAYMEEDILITFTIIGTTEEIMMLLPVVEQIIETVTVD